MNKTLLKWTAAQSQQKREPEKTGKRERREIFVCQILGAHLVPRWIYRRLLTYTKASEEPALAGRRRNWPSILILRRRNFVWKRAVSREVFSRSRLWWLFGSEKSRLKKWGIVRAAGETLPKRPNLVRIEAAVVVIKTGTSKESQKGIRWSG